MIKLSDVIEMAKNNKKMKLVVASAEEENALMSVCKAYEIGIIDTPVLVGDEEKIKEIAKKNNLNIEKFSIINKPVFEDAADEVMKIIHKNEADFVMKGLLDTAILLKAALKKEYEIVKGNLLSHVALIETKNYHKLLFLTDSGMNISPDVDQKTLIIKNAVEVAKMIGLDTIKVACLAAKEKVNKKMQATVDGSILRKAGEHGEFGDGVIVDGPIAFDLAISEEAAKIKNYKSKVAGDTDILLVPNLEMGNGIYKTLTYFADAKTAGVIMGGKVPIVLISRADSDESKLNSIALGCIVANKTE